MASSDRSGSKGLFVDEEHHMDPPSDIQANEDDLLIEQEDNNNNSDDPDSDVVVKAEPVEETAPFVAPAPTTDLVPLALYSPDTYEKFYWKACDTDTSLTSLQKVQIKEKAAATGLAHLTELRGIYNVALHQMPELKKQSDSISKILKAKRECKVKVGFLGTTGSGKSSLINCLLGYKDLLPADDAKACTAVCVQISWNSRNDLKKAFHAEILSITATEWMLEIENLRKDIDDESHNRDAEDGDPDTDRAERIKTALQNVTSVYPHLKTKRDVTSANVEELMNDSNVKAMLKTGKQIIDEPHLEDFARRIKPFIDSNNATSGDEDTNFTFWPLIKEVRLEVKSDVLRDGVCLVDLPGHYDTNAARSAVAANFTKSLSVCFVVANARRAASEKPAQDLLGVHQSRTMQLDGKYSTDRLVFIMTMCDTSISPDRYLKNNPGAKYRIGPILSAQVKMKKDRQKALDFQNQALINDNAISREVTKEIAQINSLIAEYKSDTLKRKHDGGKEDGESLTDAGKNQQQAKLQEKIQQHKSNLDSLRLKHGSASRDLLQAQKKLREIDDYLTHCESKIMRACIQHRHKTSAAAISKDFESVARLTRKKGKKGQKAVPQNPLQVFSASSLAYMTISEGGTFIGFDDQEDTGIPALRDWLVQCTLHSRNAIAEKTIKAIVSFEVATALELIDRSKTLKFTTHQVQTITNGFELSLQELGKVLDTINQLLVSNCTRVVGNMFKLMPKMELAAAEFTPAIVRSWFAKPMHWSTHRAANKYLGTYKMRVVGSDREERLIQWNEDLAGPYLDLLIPKWTTTIHANLPECRTAYLSAARKHIEDFATEVSALIAQTCPQIAPEANLLKASIIRKYIHLEEFSQAIFEDVIEDTAKKSHPFIASEIKQEWTETYKQCGSEKGKGHYKRNQKTHIAYIEDAKQRQYKRGNAKIRSTFTELWRTLPAHLKHGADEILQMNHSEFQTLVNNHVLSNSSAIKEKMQEETLRVLGHLAEQWLVPMEFEEVEVKIKVEPDMPSIDDLGKASAATAEDEDFLSMVK